MNFLCISNYNNNLDWLKKYNNPHLIYDKTWNGGYLDNNNKKKISSLNLKDKYPDFNIVQGTYFGYNVTDYFTFIIDYYSKLPDFVVFMKGNTIGRHVPEETFKKIVNNKFFTCIEDYKQHDSNQKSLRSQFALLTCDGGWMEKNNSWYLRHYKHPTKYFLSYDQFLSFCFKDPVYPKYIRFPPGGCFVVPKDQILKYEIIFYKNLKLFAEHARVSGEGQLLERALFTIWNCNFEVSNNMKQLVDPEKFIYPNKYKKKLFYLYSRIKEIPLLT